MPQSGSATYVLEGGFPALLDAPVLGRPWLTGVQPFFVPQTGNPTLTLRGTEMYLGPVPTVTIGGQIAPVGGRTADQMLVTLPDQPAPGFQPVVVTNSLGATVLNQGVGVLPLLERREPLNDATPFEIRYQGTQGDFVFLAIGFGVTPTPYELPGYRYSLQLEPSGIILSNFYFVGAADGRFTIAGPPIPFFDVFTLQALVISEAPGYAPGSWTNAQLL
jgi:hypothetical protein